MVEFAKGLVPDRVKKLRVDDGADKVLTKFLAEVSITFLLEASSD